MPADHAWELPDFIAMFVMWSVMMVAMMLPSATPMILLYEKINKKRESQGKTRNPIKLFVGGYLLIWIGFSVLATLINWALHSAGLLSSMMGRVTPVVAGISLLAAGAYQWSTLKYACLTHCRSPIGFMMTYWREGQWGAARMGRPSRTLLPRMLLAADGAFICPGCDELTLDCRASRVCVG